MRKLRNQLLSNRGSTKQTASGFGRMSSVFVRVSPSIRNSARSMILHNKKIAIPHSPKYATERKRHRHDRNHACARNSGPLFCENGPFRAVFSACKKAAPSFDARDCEAPHSGSMCSLDALRRILKDDCLPGVHAKMRHRGKKTVRHRLDGG